MLKMFSTQLNGLFKRINEKNEFEFEDGARLLAQAAVSEGTIFIKGFDEMEAIVAEAVSGAERFDFSAMRKLSNLEEVGSADRVILFTRFSTDAAAVFVGKELLKSGVPFVAVCTVVDGDDAALRGDLRDLADVVIDLTLKKGLLPDESGNRVGYPGAMAGLYAYHTLKFTLEEILKDFA